MYTNDMNHLIRKENSPKLFRRDYLRTSGNTVLYGDLESPGFLHGNHIYTVRLKIDVI